ncbi:hypothetical protein [Nitrobacter sp.]|uniref:hypothetical protein n=1 Tax=Nitrobacter sp. TaxID=29420 RepID=UPI001DA89D43|nr:hypothetical protein [Nitrobacter sp.]MCB1393240.1 hypothetical protein [Nitrobacter sp.]
MTDFPSYSLGTVSVSNGDVSIVGDGTIWSGVNARAGDTIVIGTSIAKIVDVTDDTHLKIDAWPFATVAAGASYKIIQDSPLRFVGGQAMADVSSLIARINTQGFIWTLPPGVHSPDGYVADEGQYIEDTSTNERWKMVSGSWVSQGIADPVFSRYDLVFDIPGRPGSGANVGKWVAPSTITFRADLDESRLDADVSATAESVFSITKNDVEFATITIAAAGTTAAFACAADAVFAAGDVLELIAPNPRDDTLSGIAITLVGFR